MSNADPGNDRKHYVDPETAERPDIQVAFANLRESPSEWCIGVLIPTPPGSPGIFDEREVNYRRIEVTELLSPRPSGRAWTYVGLDAARERYERGRRAGAAFVAREYAEAVEAGFRRAGGPIHREFLDSTDPIGLPTRPLRLVLRP